ncbi:MAG TPA: nuclear transport factor 2 family protein [Mycobacteriales bacterium]|nr:nuclear transport factor 2 family protein [Mycobacteriales bacterium]
MSKPSQDPAALGTRELIELERQRALALDLGGVADLFAEDATWEAPFLRQGPLRGRKEIRRMLQHTEKGLKRSGVRPLRYDPEVWHESSDPEVVIVEFVVHAEVAGSDRTFSLPYVHIFRVRDGQIVSMRDYYTDGTNTAIAGDFG